MVSAEAREHGIREGLTLAEARALCPGLVHVPYEPQQDRRSMEALARWLMRFSPVVSLDQSMEPPLPAVFLDVSGCERLYCGLSNLVEQVIEAMHALRINAGIAVAPTPGAAWAVASAQENGRIVPPQQLREALAPLPPSALRIEREIVEALHHLGIQTIGQLLELPRQALPARFGPTLLSRIDQALGRVAEPLVPIALPQPIEIGREFEGAVDSLEAIWSVLKDLIASAVIELRRRGCGARKIQLTFDRPDAPLIHKAISLSHPSRHAASLFNLARCAMESHLESGGKHSPKARGEQNREPIPGFTGVHLSIPLFELLTEEQVLLAEQEEHDGQVELDRLLERLVLRLGDKSIAKARLAQSYIPERAYIRLPPEAPAQPAMEAILETRPLHLLSQPIEISVMVSPSHDRDGRPISITHRNHVRRVMHATGPERIAGQWWDGHNKTRDYFDIEDDSAQRSWIFRVQETNKWYLHGNFE